MEKIIPKLLLFDIDGTLISTAGAGMRSLKQAVFNVCSIDNSTDTIIPHGKTDFYILEEIVKKNGIDPNLKNRITEEYIKLLPDFIENAGDSHLKKGIPELLDILERKKNIFLGLLTGNIEKGARIKLNFFNLNRYFPTGAFGSDSPERRDLVGIAVRRFESKLFNRSGSGIITNENVFIIGDTTRDIECGKENGVRTIAVASGSLNSYEELRKEAPDFLLKDLGNFDEFLDIINSE